MCAHGRCCSGGAACGSDLVKVAEVARFGLAQGARIPPSVSALLFQCLNPTWTCDSVTLTNIALGSASPGLPLTTCRHSALCTLFALFLSRAAAGLVIAAGSALPEHHHAAFNRFP